MVSFLSVFSQVFWVFLKFSMSFLILMRQRLDSWPTEMLQRENNGVHILWFALPCRSFLLYHRGLLDSFAERLCKDNNLNSGGSWISPLVHECECPWQFLFIIGSQTPDPPDKMSTSPFWLSSILCLRLTRSGQLLLQLQIRTHILDVICCDNSNSLPPSIPFDWDFVETGWDTQYGHFCQLHRKLYKLPFMRHLGF